VTDLDPRKRADLLQVLVRGKSLKAASDLTGLPLGIVRDVATELGYPADMTAVYRAWQDAVGAVRDAEQAGQVAVKRCGGCGKRLPVTEFWTDKTAPDGLYAACRDCCRSRTQRRVNSPSKVIYTRSYNRALRTLAERHREEFDFILSEELAAGTVEATAVLAAAPEAAPDGRRVVLLQAGRRRKGQTAGERVREDVGRCPMCIGSHDHGHRCPACGGLIGATGGAS